MVELTISMGEKKMSFVIIGTVVRVEKFDSSLYDI